jgi:hypothetical protein
MIGELTLAWSLGAGGTMIGELAEATFTANVPNSTTPQAFNEVI